MFLVKSPVKRRRTKKLLRELNELLHFYFSEANLRHDRFFREKTGGNGTNFVPISLLLNFPLVQELNAEEKNVVAVIEESKFLELSEDKTQIRRKFPVPPAPHDLEVSTLYVENLPRDATIAWLKEVCQKIGFVRHIAMPRYKSGSLKGFAFVEFSNPADVDKSCRILKNPPKNFFPNRTEHHLQYIKRQKLKTEETKKPTEPKTPSDNTMQSTESSNLSKSLDLAVSFDIEHEAANTFHGTMRARKRKRRQRQYSDALTAEEIEESKNYDLVQTPVKRLKSLPINLTSSDTKDVPRHEKTSENETTTKKSKNNSGRKVLFRDEEDLMNLNKRTKTECSKNLNFEQKSEQNDEESCQNAVNSTQGNPDVNFNEQTTEILTNSDGKPKPELNGIIKKSSNYSKSDDSTSESRVKRKRSISEPPQSFDIGETPKKSIKYEETIAEEKKNRNDFDIEALISAGRQRAETEMRRYFPQLSTRIQSAVVAMTTQKNSHKPKKSRNKSKWNADGVRKVKKKQPMPKLKVMPKVEWEELKREYKKLQKQNMSKLKMTIKEGRSAGSVFIKKHMDVLKNGDDSSNSSDDSSAESSKSNNKKKSAKNKQRKREKRAPPTFTPGVIARISMLQSRKEDNVNPKLPSFQEIKSRLNKYGRGIAYVDAKPGDVHGHVRFQDGQSAQRAILEEKEFALCLLTGGQEEQYWDKLLASRAQKFARERPKIRGRTKILNRAEKLVEMASRQHIRFDHDYVV